MHYCTSKHSFLIYDFQETTPLQWRKSYVLNENKKLHIFKQWVSQTMQNRMVPSLENYFFTSKTNLETMNFILKLRSFKKKKRKKFIPSGMVTSWNLFLCCKAIFNLCRRTCENFSSKSLLEPTQNGTSF